MGTNRGKSDKIEAAIGEAIIPFDEYEEGDMVIEWVVCAFVSNPNRELYGYPMFFSEGIAPHRAKGLLHQGLESLRKDDLPRME